MKHGSDANDGCIVDKALSRSPFADHNWAHPARPRNTTRSPLHPATHPHPLLKIEFQIGCDPASIMNESLCGKSLVSHHSQTAPHR
ncbi:Uncharacterised protein [Vibrio cholerae]|nr:Uncharacterised protein [Vibrio cholerae]